MAQLKKGRLKARPGQPVSAQAPLGLQSLEWGGICRGFWYAPNEYQTDHPLPLVVMLHGAGGSARGSFGALLPVLKQAGLFLLAPDSQGQTWDLIEGHGYGPDVACLDQTLSHLFRRYAVDQTHLALGGFSDGASYALSLGLTNGDLFTHLFAFSPGFLAPTYLHGQPHIFIAHGTHDSVLPIDRCSRQIVPRLQRDRYHVHYQEFDGPHTVPRAIVWQAWHWFLETGRPP